MSPSAMDRQRCPECAEKLWSARHLKSTCPGVPKFTPADEPLNLPEPLGRKESQDTLGDPDMWRGGY